jgi:hypothetical protein
MSDIGPRESSALSESGDSPEPTPHAKGRSVLPPSTQEYVQVMDFVLKVVNRLENSMRNCNNRLSAWPVLQRPVLPLISRLLGQEWRS